jgi:Zn-dependent protease
MMFDRFLADPAAALQGLLLMLPALLLAVTVHEVAHGWVADRLGDPTARLSGRLTLNPLPHIDPLGALAFVVAGFGWARPVPVNARNLRHPRRDMAWVAAAGPVSNLLLAFLGLVAWVLVSRTITSPFVAEPLQGMLRYVYLFNLGLAIFNLIPLPPLDGGHFLPYLLPRRSWPLLAPLERWGPLLLILLILSGATRHVLGPALVLLSGAYLALVRWLL